MTDQQGGAFFSVGRFFTLGDNRGDNRADNRADDRAELLLATPPPIHP